MNTKFTSSKVLIPVLGIIAIAAVAGGAYLVATHNKKDDTVPPRTAALDEYSNKNYDKAAEIISQEISAKPADPSNYNILGNISRDKGDTEAAITNYKKAIEIDDKQLPTYINLASLYANNNRKSEAVATADAGLKLFPENKTLLKIKEESK